MSGKESKGITINGENFALVDVMHSFSRLQTLIKEIENVRDNLEKRESTLIQWSRLPTTIVTRAEVDQMLKVHFEQVSVLNYEYWKDRSAKIMEALNKKADMSTLENELKGKLTGDELKKMMNGKKQRAEDLYNIIRTDVNYSITKMENQISLKADKTELNNYSTNEIVNCLNERVIVLEADVDKLKNKKVKRKIVRKDSDQTSEFPRKSTVIFQKQPETEANCKCAKEEDGKLIMKLKPIVFFNVNLIIIARNRRRKKGREKNNRTD